ncbi:hypothetical protein ALP25_00295 [Pseudomonas syringae pv. syringae]|uniref:ParB N-terminal domain-containing protein n=1 Tax=Pseudomonas syringae TaxID=317 RepID=UPI000EFEDBBB|nr:ParB N-terminal domain-containing protein [Pseudomonas syringae]RMU60261.1 hypothetical protein ALP25_00295 [Pseudomonas syringae pv. syringae]
MSTREIELIPVAQLNFDPQNPRFSRYFGTDAQPEPAVIERMVKAENVQELMGSIGEQGYFSGEPLLVAKSASGLIVVEGNRRLAALKLLLGLINAQTPLPSIEALRGEAKNFPKEVECIVFEERKDILRYLGYRHITGAKKWDSLSKARYLKQLKDEFYQSLTEEEQLKAIAKEIGSRKDYVAQMLTGLKVFSEAENAGFYGMQRVRSEDVDFGVLTTALSYNNIATFLGLTGRTDIRADGLNHDRSKELLSWIFAQDQQGYTILGESRNLRKLSAVVANDAARENLRKTGMLDFAYLLTEGPSEAFNNALEVAYKRLLAAYEMIPSLDSFDKGHLSSVEKLNELTETMSFMIGRALKRQSREEGNHE